MSSHIEPNNGIAFVQAGSRAGSSTVQAASPIRPSNDEDSLVLLRNGCSHVLSPADPEPQDLLSRLAGDVYMRLDSQARTALGIVAAALAKSTAERRGQVSA